MDQIDQIAHVVQLSVAPVFLLTGVGTLLNVLSGRLARIIDRARVLEQQLEVPEPACEAEIRNELRVLEKRGRVIYHAVRLSTISALLVCFVIAALFASSLLHDSIRLIVIGLFIAAMLTLIVSLALFLREVEFAIGTFEIAIPAGAHDDATDCRNQGAQSLQLGSLK